MILVLFVVVFLIAAGLGLVLLKLRPRSFRLKATATRWFQFEVEMTDPIERGPAVLQSSLEDMPPDAPSSDHPTERLAIE